MQTGCHEGTPAAARLPYLHNRLGDRGQTPAWKEKAMVLSKQATAVLTVEAYAGTAHSPYLVIISVCKAWNNRDQLLCILFIADIQLTGSSTVKTGRISKRLACSTCTLMTGCKATAPHIPQAFMLTRCKNQATWEKANKHLPSRMVCTVAGRHKLHCAV